MPNNFRKMAVLKKRYELLTKPTQQRILLTNFWGRTISPDSRFLEESSECLKLRKEEFFFSLHCVQELILGDGGMCAFTLFVVVLPWELH